MKAPPERSNTPRRLIRRLERGRSAPGKRNERKRRRPPERRPRSSLCAPALPSISTRASDHSMEMPRGFRMAERRCAGTICALREQLSRAPAHASKELRGPCRRPVPRRIIVSTASLQARRAGEHRGSRESMAASSAAIVAAPSLIPVSRPPHPIRPGRQGKAAFRRDTPTDARSWRRLSAPLSSLFHCPRRGRCKSDLTRPRFAGDPVESVVVPAILSWLLSAPAPRRCLRKARETKTELEDTPRSDGCRS